tara:strand:- start:223 stop:567 length:345 start_codon:yes stop_codon:yes gene_type:complete
MKKLLAIIILGLLLVSCSEYSDNKKIKKIKICADPNPYSGWVVDKNENIVVGLLSLELREKIDPLNLYPDHHLIKFDSLSLETKFRDKAYEKIWTECERELSLTPIKFKEKYLK